MHHFAVLHITKYKGKLAAIGAHIDRLHRAHNVNNNKIGFNQELAPDSKMNLLHILGSHIDNSKSALTENYPAKSSLSLAQAVQMRIRQGHNSKETIRKDAVLAIGVILTGSHERMMQIQADPKLFNDWKKANFYFACHNFGRDNIVRFTLHLDEKTPHFHCVFVPINKQSRLSARSFINGAERLRQYQDHYASAMNTFGLGRGIPKILSHRVHIPTKDYYQTVQQLTRQAQELTSTIKKTNLLKLEHVRDMMTQNITRLKVALLEQTTKSQHALTTSSNLIHRRQKIAYQKRLEEDSHRAYEWIKRKIPLLPFLTTQLGWTVDKTKSTRRDIVLTHPKHSKILVPTRPVPTTGHWVYASVNSGGGTLIDLLLQENWSWKQIKALADDNMIENVPVTPIEEFSKKDQPIKLDPALQTQKAQSRLEQIVSTQKSSYLTHRGINKTTYQGLKGLKVSYQAAVFPLYKDFDRTGKPHLCSTISYYKDRLGHCHKYFQKGLPRGLTMLHEKNFEDITKIVVTESPIDALSYRQMQLEKSSNCRLEKEDTSAQEQTQETNTLFLSTCGNLTNQIKKDLEQLFYIAHQNEQIVVLALDNDLAGRNMTETLSHVLEEAHCTYYIEVPTKGKDWNETLTWQHNQEQQAAIESNKAIAQRQWQVFEASNYEASVLQQLGIKRHTFEAFQDSVQVNEQAMLVALQECKAAGKLVGTWTVSWDKDKGVQEHIAYDGATTAATLTVIKGSLEEAQQIVITTSPLEALVHYQEQVQAIEMLQTDAVKLNQQHYQTKEEQQQEDKPYQTLLDHKPSRQIAYQQRLAEHKTQLNNTCYVYADIRSTQGLETAINEFLQVVKGKEQGLILACSQSGDRLAKELGLLLEKQSRQYTKEFITLPQNNHKIATSLAHSISLVSALANTNVNMDGEVYDEEPNRRKIITRRTERIHQRAQFCQQIGSGR